MAFKLLLLAIAFSTSCVTLAGIKGMPYRHGRGFLIASAPKAAKLAALFTDDFSSRETKWTGTVHEKLIKVEFGAKGRNFTGLLVTGVNGAKIDTAWNIRSPRIVLPEKRKPYFVLSFDVAPDVELAYTSEQGVQWQNVVFWYDAAGKPYGRCPLGFTAKAGDFQTVRVAGRIPPDAASFEIQIGFDVPNLWGGSSVAYKSLQFSLADSMAVAQRKSDRGDFSPPRVRMTSPSPTTDRKMRPSFTVTDETGVDWAQLRVTVDGKEASGSFEREGDLFTWKGETDWAPGIHKVDVAVADVQGRKYVSRKRFFIGEPPKVPKVTLRDDGMTLVDGKAIFPIGLYGVMRREFNGYDFARAFDGLKAGGFTAAHSYGEARDSSFLAEAQKRGFWLWMETRLPGSRFADKERHYPHVLAWYLGDDTSGHEKPWELADYDEATKAVDPNRITCQADGVRSAAQVSAYRDYVEGTDVFLPEIYPMVLDTPEENRECVARVIRDMKRIASDIKESGVVKPRGIWPIIQYFQGWGWKHFPTREELFAMTFAAVCHGAHGMTWYAYCGTVKPEKKQYNYGVTSTPERWKNICDLAARLKSLAPVLTERTVPDAPEVQIVSGLKTDPLGFASVSTLVKRHKGECYLFAVNSSDRTVSARIDLRSVCPDAGSAAQLFENHDFKFAGGRLSCEFPPFAVRIWKIRSVDIALVSRTKVEDTQLRFEQL